MDYAIFCLGAAMLQLSFTRTPNPGETSMSSPPAFSTPAMHHFLFLSAIASAIAEIACGASLFSWWVGLLSVPVSLLVVSIAMSSSRNPAPPLFLGSPLLTLGLIMMLL